MSPSHHSQVRCRRSALPHMSRPYSWPCFHLPTSPSFYQHPHTICHSRRLSAPRPLRRPLPLCTLTSRSPQHNGPPSSCAGERYGIPNKTFISPLYYRELYLYLTILCALPRYLQDARVLPNHSISASLPFDWEAARGLHSPPYSPLGPKPRGAWKSRIDSPNGKATPTKRAVRKKSLYER
jgi:hypothetical protein